MHSRSVTHGDTTPIVLIHGLVISSLYWIPLAESFAPSRTVHALDLPGFGRSPAAGPPQSMPQLAASVLRWLDAAGLQKSHVVANSMGCQIAAHLALLAPERLVTLTLIGATIDAQAHRFATEAGRLLLDAVHEPPRLWANWLFDFARAGLPRAIGTTRRMFQDYIEEQLPRISTPTLVLRGEHDPTMHVDWAREIVRLLPLSRLETIPKAPHCAHFTHPIAVKNAIEAWIRQSEKTEMDITRS